MEFVLFGLGVENIFLESVTGVLGTPLKNPQRVSESSRRELVWFWLNVEVFWRLGSARA
jgi:hypothetical protein